MEYFNTAFTLLMILFPAAFTLFVREHESQSGSRQSNRRLTGLLWLATAAAVGAYAILYQWRPAVAYFMWMACFPLWFLLAMPLLRARNPGWREPERGAQRSAKLVRRDRIPAGLRLAWIGLCVVWALLLGITILGFAAGEGGDTNGWFLAFNLIAGGEIWLFYWAMRRSLIEPEALSENESEALRAERVRFHRFKLYGWFGAATAAVLVFSLPSLFLAWFGSDALTLVIVVGAGGGALVGVGGGVFGTMASIRRARINRMLFESTRQESN